MQLFLVLTQLCPGGNQISKVCAQFLTVQSLRPLPKEVPKTAVKNQAVREMQMERTQAFTEEIGGTIRIHTLHFQSFPQTQYWGKLSTT